MMKNYVIDDKYIDSVFTMPYEDNFQELLKSNDIKKYRLKSIFSGSMLESEGFPIWKTSKKNIEEKVKTKSRLEQIALNHKNTRKKIIRLINANFTQKDIWITVGYRNNALPKTEQEAKRNVVNYIRKIQRYCTKHNLPKLKYVYVTEFAQDVRVHHHIILNFHDRDIAESFWTKGEYPQARRLKPNDFGLEGLARYISKEPSEHSSSKKPKGLKSYGYSLNLHKSWKKECVKTADSKLSRAKSEKIARGKIDAKEFYEKLYPGYRFIDLDIRYSNYCSGCYLYARLVKKDEIISKKKRGKKE